MSASKLERTFIEHLEFVLTVDEKDSVIRDATVVIERDRIAAVGESTPIGAEWKPGPSDRRLNGRRFGMTPGFIDTHVHLSETLSRGLFPDNLSTRPWVFHWAKPFYAHVMPEDERVSVLLGAAEMIRSGTTCFLDMGAQHDPGITARAAAEIGIRGIVGRHAADQKPEFIPPGWSEEMVEHHFFPDAKTALATLEACVHDWNGYDEGRIRCWVNIEGKEPCSVELHVGARELAEKLGVGTTYHIASSIEEAHGSERRYGVWPITRISELGGLGANLILAHAVAMLDSEVALLAENGTKVAFCPSTSLKLAKGATSIGKYPEMLEAGVVVGLGTDGVSAAGNLHLMRQLYLAAGLFKDARCDPEMVGARKALRMGTIDGARALGWDDQIGSIEEGKKADFVLFDLDHSEWTPYDDPLQALVWSVTPASIVQTWVDGRPVFSDDNVRRIDESSLRSEARSRAVGIAKRAGLRRGDIPTTTSLYD
jgi:cytosine/adenosine deaminase-related metal-dependent hydrolase